MSKVSVVIPFYEQADWLEEAVESVLQQDYTDIEIIVVNDGSKEDVTRFLDKYGDKIVYEKKENGGPSTARNRGIELATGEYIAFLDSDDIWLPEKLPIQVAMMKKYDAVWSYCNYSTFGVGKVRSYVMTKEQDSVIQRYYAPYIATPCVMVRKDYLDEHTECRFNPALRYGEDSYMWLTINANSAILAIPKDLVRVRIRGGNAARRARVQLQARSNIWKCRKANRELLIDKFEVSSLFVVASELCTFRSRIVVFFSRIVKKESVIELISKVFFLLPWSLFKLDRIIRKKKNEEK